MTTITNLFNDISTRKFDITTTSAGATQIQQTQRNALKREIMSTVCASLAEALAETPFNVVMTANGIAIEVPNQNIADATDAGSGAITLFADIKVGALDIDATAEGEIFAQEQAEKAEKKAEAARKKAEKIAKATAAREAKAKTKA